ncbi:MAG: hypothetical protein CVV61_07275 [Tenericutes bacterium HGW-Tenericutes-6]|nr:MAG: hypothetical protein CVV61_07275 [Tenericutes bacterium HGW-Tenericutes-6]
MDFVIDFVMSTAGYFILSYFIFQITGRRHKYINVMFLVFIVIETVQVVEALLLNINVALILLTLRVLPLLLSWYLFLRFTNGLHFKLRFKRQTIKGIKHEIITSKRAKTGAIYMICGAVPLFLVGYFFMEEIMNYIVYLSAVLSLIGGIWIYLDTKRIKTESVIVFIGKDKEFIYQYDIPIESYKVQPVDFFKNEDFIIDPIGEVRLISDDKHVEVHYLYWVATSTKVDLKDSPLYKINQVPYIEDLHIFEKYHYKKMMYQYLKTGAVEKIKEKVVK